MDTQNANTAIINALAAAVLANASDYDVTCEITRRGLNLDITSLSDEALKAELLARDLVTDDPRKAITKLAEAFENEGADPAWPELNRLARVLPDEVILERTQTLEASTLDDLIDTLAYNGAIDLSAHFDDDLLWEAITDKDGILENAMDEADDAELWSHIRFKEDVIKDHLDHLDDELLWEAIFDKEAVTAQAMKDYVKVCTPEALGELLKQIAERVASEMAA